MSIAITGKTFTLEYVKTIGMVNNSLSGRGFANPYDTAISHDGRIFVLDRCDPLHAGAVRVGICTFEEEYLGEFGYGYGGGDGQMRLPVAMAFDSADRLYVTDEYNHRVTVFDSSGTFLDRWGTFGDGEDQVNGPAGIAIDGEDNVYIADQHNHRIQKFTAEGSFLRGWGELGSGEGQFNMPWGGAVDSLGDVYVADWRNDRIQRFSPDGQFVASYGESGDGDGQFHRPSSVAVDPEGFIYVADWGNERVQVLDPDGGFVLNLRGQATLSKWAREFFDANLDERDAREVSDLFPDLPPHVDTPFQTSSQMESYFWGPVSVKLDPAGRVYVTESSRHRLQVYQKR